MNASGERRSFGEFLHAALRDEWDGLERINRDLRLADFFTILNALMGLGAILLAALGEVRGAIHLVLLGVIMDGLDGAVARLGKGNGPLGGTLDSLADAVSFVAAPAVVTMLWWHPRPEGWETWLLVVAPLSFYMVCGLLRLARFEALRDDGKARSYFSGIPSPAAGMTLLALILVDTQPSWVVPALAVYIGTLMVSRIRFPKLRGWWAVGALAVLVAVLAAFNNPGLQRGLTWGLLSFMLLYVVVGPFYVLARYGAVAGPRGTSA